MTALSREALPRSVPGVFRDAEEEYVQALERWHVAAETLRDAQARLREADREVQYADAVLRLTPGLKGSTADARAAHVVVLARDDPEHRKLITAADSYRAEVARWQDECAAARDTMAKAKRVMDFSTALLTFKSSQLQGGEHDKRYGRR